MDKINLFLCLTVLCILVFQTEGLLRMEADCRTQEGGPYYFKKIDSMKYKCVRDGPEYSCPYTWTIPSWYTYGSTDPCLCMSVPSIYGEKQFCPPDPMLGARTTANPVTEKPMEGTIDDSGCPSPYRRYPRTLRIYNTSRADVQELPITGELGFTTSENECKYHCLALGACAGITYSEQDGIPMCIGFFMTATSYDFRGSQSHDYYEKVWCVQSSRPVLPTPPPIQDGLLLVNAAQGPKGGKVFLKDVDEMSCITWCFYERSCAAVDYNKDTEECTYFTETSCEAHSPVLDQCCNHYKKKISKC